MSVPPGVLLAGVIFLLLLAVGIFAAVIIYLGKGSSDERPEPAAAERPAQERPAAVVPPAAAPAEAPAHPGEVMRVIRDEATGRLLVEVEGRRYASIREIEDARVGRRVLWAIADLVRFTGGMATNPQAMRSIGEPPAAGPAAPPPTTASPLPSSSARTTVSSLAEPERQSYNMAEFFRRGFQATEPAPAAARSFIDEIDDILQGYLERVPNRTESVHVRSAEDGTLRIEVGTTHYDSIEEVPVPEIQRLIRAAVAEWERR